MEVRENIFRYITYPSHFYSKTTKLFDNTKNEKKNTFNNKK